MKRIMLSLCLFGTSACYQEYVSTEGHISFNLDNHQINIINNVKGQIYRDRNMEGAYKKHRYILQNLSDENVRINFQLQSSYPSQTVFDFDSSGLSTVKLSDQSHPSGFKIYQSVSGQLNIEHLTNKTLKGSFHFKGVNKKDNNDTLKIAAGGFEISNPEFYNSVVP